MKGKHEPKKTYITRKLLYNQLVTSFKRAYRIIGGESGSALNPRVSTKGSSSMFLTRETLQRINEQMLEIEKLRADGLQLVRKHASHA